MRDNLIQLKDQKYKSRLKLLNSFFTFLFNFIYNSYSIKILVLFILSYCFFFKNSFYLKLIFKGDIKSFKQKQFI